MPCVLCFSNFFIFTTENRNPELSYTQLWKKWCKSNSTYTCTYFWWRLWFFSVFYAVSALSVIINSHNSPTSHIPKFISKYTNISTGLSYWYCKIETVKLTKKRDEEMSMINLEISFKTTSSSYRLKVPMESHLILNLDTLPPTVTQPNIISACYFTRCIFSYKNGVKPPRIQSSYPCTAQWQCQHTIDNNTDDWSRSHRSEEAFFC